MVVCMFCTGYSTWTITAPLAQTASFSMQSYPVIRSDDYVQIGTPIFSDYCSSAITTSDDSTDGKTSDMARITIPVTLTTECFTSGIFSKNMCIRLTISFITKNDENGKPITINFMEYYDGSATMNVEYDGSSFKRGDYSFSHPKIWDNDNKVEVNNKKIAYIDVDLSDLATTASTNETFNITIDFKFTSTDVEFFSKFSQQIVIQTVVKDSHTS